ncbi:hypothetical protein [Paracidovorax anthurii]|nr:hypothetical protein [Paracidovorax anthurii]
MIKPFEKLFGKRGSYLAAFLLAVLALVGVFLARVDRPVPEGKTADEVKAGQQASASQSQFPWHLATGQEQGGRRGELAAHEEKKDLKQSLASMLSPLENPRLPVDKMVAQYLGKHKRSLEDQMEIISALSFCANRRGLGNVIAQSRSAGLAEEVRELSVSYDAYVEYCKNLGDGYYSLRKDILGSLAASGDLEAKKLYFEVGPMGRWLGDEEYLPLTKEQINEWSALAVSYLQQSAQAGDRGAYKTLASIYKVDSEDRIIGGYSDKMTSYAYDYVWAASVIADPDVPETTKRSVTAYIRKIESGLSSTEKDEGRAKALAIHSKVKN